MAAEGTPGLNRIERVLAFMIAASAGLAIVVIVVLLLGSFLGWDMSGGLWPGVLMIPFVALPLAFVLIVAFLIVSTVRRRPQNGAG